MTQFTVPAQNFTVGTHTFQQALPQGAVHSFSVDCDASSWTQPATVSVEVDSSFDGGATYHHTVSVFEAGPPPWPADGGATTSHITFTTTYGGGGTTPDHVQLQIVVTDRTVRLGPAVVTVT